MDMLRGGAPGTGPTGGSIVGQHDNKDNDVEGKLFIGGISWQTTEEGLRHHFGKYGTLADIALMKDKYTGHPRGFGFIKFEDLTVLDEVLAQEHKIDGKLVDVKRAVPKSEAPGPSSRSIRPPETNKIFVGGLAPTVMMAEFRKYFETFGGVVDAVVMFDRQTQRSRGFGFVTFQEDAVVHEIMMGSHEINGKMVEVKRAEPKENRNGRTPRDNFSGGSSPALGAGGSAAFSGPRRSQPFVAGRGAGPAYVAGNSFAYNNSGTPFNAAAVASSANFQATFPYSGYGYNGQQLYSAPTTYAYNGRGTGVGYSAEAGNGGASFPVPLPQVFGMPAQDGQTPYTQAEYAAALRSQQQVQVQAQQQVQVQAQQQQQQQQQQQTQVQQATRAGEGAYGNQPY